MREDQRPHPRRSYGRGIGFEDTADHGHLLAGCLFVLLLSSAFAQEKSPEQLREERSHIFGIEGLQTQTFTRFVASGAKQRMGFYAHINPDCSAYGENSAEPV
jgi:hypothetical protein